MYVNSIVFIFPGENRTIFLTLHFIDKLLSTIVSENATLPIPMPCFVVIELVVSELWLFEVAITR